jgi:hypothetical protein
MITHTYSGIVRDREIIDSELRLVALLRHPARERGGPLPSIAVVDALLDERRELGVYRDIAESETPQRRG